MSRVTVAIRIEAKTGRVLDVRVFERADLVRAALPTAVNKAFDGGHIEPVDGASRWVVRLVEMTT